MWIAASVQTRSRQACTNGAVERFQGTILHEHWRIAFRREYFGSVRALQRSLDGFLRFAGTLELAGLDTSITTRRVEAILKALPQYVDGIDPASVDRRTIWSGLRPCTPSACMSLLAHHGVALKGLRAVVLGRSEIVGKPMALMLLEQHATVTIAHSRTKDLPAVCREADLLVAAVGRPGLVEGSWIKPGAVVVDVGSKAEALAKLAENSPGAMYSFLLRPDGTSCMPYVSSRIEELTGLRPEELTVDMPEAFARIHSDDIARLQESIAESARTLSPWHTEFRIRHPEKGVIWLEGRSMPEPQHDGAILWYGFLHDITERKRVQEENERRSRQMALLHETSIELSAELNLNELLHSIAQRALELIGGVYCNCYLYRPDDDPRPQPLLIFQYGLMPVPQETFAAVTAL